MEKILLYCDRASAGFVLPVEDSPIRPNQIECRRVFEIAFTVAVPVHVDMEVPVFVQLLGNDPLFRLPEFFLQLYANLLFG